MKKSWSQLEKQDFVELNKNLTAPDIAKMFGVTSGAVYYRFRMFGINPGKRNRKFNPPREELAVLYEKMPMLEIAKHYGVGETAVFMRLKEHGIGGISRSERLSGKPKSLNHRLAMSASARASGIRSGERNGNWKGGVAKDGLRARSKAAYMEWKSAVFAKAQWKCEGCSKEHGSVCVCCGHRTLLHAHHIIPFSEKPELRYEPSNGKALCEQCHWKEHHEIG